MSVSLRRTPVVVLLVVILAVAAGWRAAPARADFASVTVHFTNEGDLPLLRAGDNLDHGCWDTRPPDQIDPHQTVTWKSVSCGLLTATEGWALYRPYGAPNGIQGRFYWDDPTYGDNTAQNAAPSGCTSSQTNPPSGGLNWEVTFKMTCDATSGDGIADVWKLNKAAFDANGTTQIIDLPAMGAVVGHKDIFVQLDWMRDDGHNQKLTPAVLKRITEAYKANGYYLHIDAGSDSVLNYDTGATWGALSQAKPTGYQDTLGTSTVDASGKIKYDWTAFNAIKAANFNPTGRGQIFHYVLAAHQINAAGNSGISNQPGTNVIISLGTFTGGVGSEDEQTTTLMHELGHNLGLGHGGGDDVNYKPNYFSVMNYAFQFDGITKNGTTSFDYSHGGQRTLTEPNPPGLDEASGVGPAATGIKTTHWCPARGALAAARIPVPDAGGRIDWNCDGVPDVNPVGADINGDPLQPANTLGTLSDYDDWAHLNLAVGGIGSFGAPITPPPTESILDDPTPQTAHQTLPVDTTAPTTTAQATPAANAAGWNNSDVTVTLTPTDDISGTARTEYTLDDGAWTEYTAPIALSTDAIHTVKYRSIDRASNVEDAKSLTVKLDKTAPTVTYTGGAPTYGILDTVSITCTTADNLSGVASTTCKDVTGPAYDFAPGTNEFSATATDAAGNTGQGSVSFTLKVTYDDMCTLTKQWVTNPGAAHSNAMCAQLAAAKQADDRGNTTAKNNIINAYVNELDAAVHGGFMTAAHAATLKKLAAAL